MANGLPLTQYSDAQLQDVVDKAQAVDNMMQFDAHGDLTILMLNGVEAYILQCTPELSEFICAVHELVTMISDPA